MAGTMSGYTWDHRSMAKPIPVMQIHGLDDQTVPIEGIQARNARVEANKAWEVSWTRRIIITLATYVAVGLYLPLLGVKDNWFHALAAAGAYLISTLTMPLFKTLWTQKIYGRNKTE